MNDRSVLGACCRVRGVFLPSRLVLLVLLPLAGCGSSQDDDGADGAGRGGSVGQGQGGGGNGGAGLSGAGEGAAGIGPGGAGGRGGGSVGGSGGSAADSGAGGASSASSRYAICIEYARAVEDRLYRGCHGGPPLDPDQHAMREADCPDLLFADGSNRTVDDVRSCIETWRNAACDGLLAGAFPECLPRGQRALGAGCVFNVQCSTGRCGGAPDAAGCKRCVEEAAVGAACVDPAVQCPYDAPCDGQVCAALMATPITRGDCGEGKPCPTGSYCTATDAATLECTTFPGVGEACEAICDQNLLCSRSSRSCVTLPLLGQPCPDGECEAAAFCRDGVSFDPQPMELPPICMARLALGDACAGGATDDELGNSACPLDTKCRCDDDACATLHCAQELYEGEPCEAPFSFCTPGTECLAGACEGVESQGLSDRCP